MLFYQSILVYCRPRVFFRQVLEIIDAVVVLVSFIVVIVDVAIEKDNIEYIK